MQGARSRYGLLVSALGAVLLAVAVFLPWYGVSLTPAGIQAARQASEQVAQEFGNATLQSEVSSEAGDLGLLSGREVASLSAHQVLHDLNVVLLALAALALLDALIPLARAGSPLPDGAGRALVLLGLVAAACVVYRMVSPPAGAEGLFALKLREGAWFALLGSAMVLLGGIWPHSAILRAAVGEDGPAPAGGAGGGDAFAALSGWTPGS